MKRCYTQNKSKNSRSNLGADIPVLVYRMLEYSLRDAITERFGKDVQVELFRKAGRTAGEYFARHFLDLTLPMNGFVGELQAKMQEQRIGVLRIESIDEEKGEIMLTVSEDAVCRCSARPSATMAKVLSPASSACTAERNTARSKSTAGRPATAYAASAPQ